MKRKKKNENSSGLSFIMPHTFVSMAWADMISTKKQLNFTYNDDNEYIFYVNLV